MDTSSVSERIEYLGKCAGSLRRLDKAAGLPFGHAHALIGRITNPHLSTLHKIADGAGVARSWVTNGDGPTPGAVLMVAMGDLPDGRPIMTPNHAGIYLGNHRILHHLTRRNPIDFTRKSARQPLSHWKPFFNADPIWVRHRDLKTKGLIEI